jgi:DNA-binding transcriptional MerR regulator
VTPKLYKAGEVCDLVQVQLYVLRSWEKEFPGIGIQKSAETPRLYRQSDLEYVQRIKQLVFGEGLTVSGARRRLEETMPASSGVSASEAADVLDALSADARSRIGKVRDGLREIRSLLSAVPGSPNGSRRGADRPASASAAAGSKKVHRGEFELKPPPVKPARAKARPAAAQTKSVKRGAAAKASSARKKAPTTKRKRARLRA